MLSFDLINKTPWLSFPGGTIRPLALQWHSPRPDSPSLTFDDSDSHEDRNGSPCPSPTQSSHSNKRPRTGTCATYPPTSCRRVVGSNESTSTPPLASMSPSPSPPPSQERQAPSRSQSPSSPLSLSPRWRLRLGVRSSHDNLQLTSDQQAVLRHGRRDVARRVVGDLYERSRGLLGVERASARDNSMERDVEAGHGRTRARST